MVKIKIIEEVLEKAFLTVKCKINRIGINNLNNHIKGALNRFAEYDAKLLEYERMQCIGKNGKVLFQRDGERYQVSWSNEDVQKALQSQEGDFINEHNHPTSYIEATGEMLNVPTCLSRKDVENLWKVSVVSQTEDGVDMLGTVWRGVVAECSNGSRMSLIRRDDDTYLNSVVQDYVGREYDGELPDNNKEEFMEAYNILSSDWKAMLKDYKKSYNSFVDEWISTHSTRDSLADPSNWNENDIIYDTSEEYMEEFNKSVNKFSKDYFADENSTWNGNLRFDIRVFKDLGWDLSLEWRQP